MKVNIFRYFRGDYIPWQFWLWLAFALIAFAVSGLLKGAEVGALLFTAVFIAWYSIETRNLVKETKTSNSLATQPVLVVGYSREGDWKIFLRNIGKGAGIDIKIETKTATYKIELTTSILAQGEKAPIRVFKNRPEGDYGLIEDYLQEFQNQALDIKITFRDTLKANELQAMAKIHNPPRIDMII